MNKFVNIALLKALKELAQKKGLTWKEYRKRLNNIDELEESILGEKK